MIRTGSYTELLLNKFAVLVLSLFLTSKETKEKKKYLLDLFSKKESFGIIQQQLPFI